MKTFIKASKNPWVNKIEILIGDESKRGVIGVATDIVFHKKEEGEMLSPSLVIDGDSAQQLMDDLYQCGIRPSEASGSVGQLSATERHLKDMQRIVFKDYENK